MPKVLQLGEIPETGATDSVSKALSLVHNGIWSLKKMEKESDSEGSDDEDEEEEGDLVASDGRDGEEERDGPEGDDPEREPDRAPENPPRARVDTGESQAPPGINPGALSEVETQLREIKKALGQIQAFLRQQSSPE